MRPGSDSRERMGNVVGLFAMNGSASDERQEDRSDPQETSSELDAITEPLPVDRDAEPAEPTSSRADETKPLSATAQEIAAYLVEFGTVTDDRAFVRPYARTGGRTKAGTYLAIEALLVAAPSDLPPRRMAAEHRLLRQICGDARSVAEVAAQARLPIGGARVIIADMLDIGLLVRCSDEESAGVPSADLMARVLSGLRTL